MRKLLLLGVAFLFITGELLAQKSITGTVKDEKGNPLPNVSVMIKGSKSGTVTNPDGTYSLSVPENAKTLVFSSVDMSTSEANIGSGSVINITLKNDNKLMQEVVVIGYGTQQKKAITSAISKIKGDDVSNLPSASFDRQLAGRAAGVQVTQTSGLANAEPRIRIRGVNSISLNRDPLFVIDGVPTFSAVEGGLSGIATVNSLSDLNPADIESIEVLKDGAATAIYGSRAANGVILITTKKGKSGKATVNYDFYIGSSKSFRTPDLLNAQEFVTIANEKLTNANLAQGAFMNAENTNTDWMGQVFRSSAKTQNHSLSVSGGNDKTNYYFSLNYSEQDGIIITNLNRHYGIRANFEHKVNKYVKVGNNITLSRSQDNDQNNGGNALSGAMGAAMRALPNVRVYNPGHPTGYNLTAANDALGVDSNKRVIENNYSNIRYVLDKNKFSSDRYRIIDNAFIEISPVSWLSIRSQASVDYQAGTDFRSLDPIHGDGRSSGGSLFEQSLQRSRYVWQNYLNLNKTIANFHTIGVTAGVEMQRDISRFFNGQGTGISDIFFSSDNIISNTYANQFSGGSFSKAGFQSYFGRLTYDYKGKYFGQFTMRRDGQSSLAPDKRYGNFPGGSVGWRVSEEDFWKAGLSKTINDFKLRGSYAVVGNNLTGFAYLSTYGPSPYGGISGNAINLVGNSGLKWETNKKIDIGADLSFLNSRFTLTVDYFKNKNDDQILQAPTPPSLGIPGNFIYKNIGNMENKGWEFNLGGMLLKKGDFTWSVNLNFTTTKNKVISLVDSTKEQLISGPNNGTFNILRIGEPLNGFYGYEYAGVNSANGNAMWVKADGTLVQYNATVTGSGYFLVVKPGDPILGAASSLASADRKIIGSPIPTWFGGISNTFSYKQFGMEVFFRFSGGNKVYNLTRQEVLNSQGFVNNGTEILNRWTPANTNTDVPKLYYGRDNLINLGGQMNSRFLEKGDFLRLQNLNLYYYVDGNVLEKATNGYIKSARIFFQGQNLAIWTKYSGIDPENTTELGIDNSSVPQLRTYTFGLNLGF